MGDLVKIHKVIDGKVAETREVDSTLVDIILGLSLPKGQYYEIAPPDIQPAAVVPPEITYAKSVEDMDFDELKILLKKQHIKVHPAIKTREKLLELVRRSL